MALLQAVFVGLIALILTPGWLFYLDVTPKLIVLLMGAAALLPFASPVTRPPRIVSFLAIAWIVSLAISSSLSSQPALSWFGSSWRRCGAITQIAILLFAWSVVSRGDRRTMLRAVAIATGLASLYGLAQFAGFDPILPAASYHIGEGVWTIVRPPSTFGHAAYFATWLTMAAFLGVALARIEKMGPWKAVGLACGAVAAVTVLFTGTRAGLLALAAGAAVLFVRRGMRVTRIALASSLAVLLALVALYLSPAGTQLRSRTRWFMEDPWGGARLTLWRDAIAMGLSRPWTGFGPEVFQVEFPHYQSVELSRAYPDFAHESPHNILLDAMVSQGIPGMLALMSLLAVGLRTRDPAIAAALTAGIISQQFTVFTIPTALLTFVTLALALPWTDVPVSGRISDPGRARQQAARRALALAPAFAMLVYLGVRVTCADAYLASAQRNLRAGSFRHADADYERYAAWRLPGTSADLWYSRALFEWGKRQTNPAVQIQAIARSGAAAWQATTTSEEPFNAWYNVAQLSAARNDPEGAEQALRASIAASPNWFKPHWSLARLLQLRGRRSEAQAEAAKALHLDAGKHAEVGATLASLRTDRP